MVRPRKKAINQSRNAPATPRTSAATLDRRIQTLHDAAMESHALAHALAAVFCDRQAGTVPEPIEKLIAMTERSTRLVVEQVDDLQRSRE